MEEQKLKELFTKVIDQLTKKGYAPINIRESFDRIAPPLPWQHNWLIFFIMLAAFLTGVFIPPLIIFSSFFLHGTDAYVVATVLMGAAGFLFYFALSAFNIHEWAKMLFTFLMSLLMAGVTYISHFAATRVVNNVQSKLSSLAPLAEMPGAPAEASLLQTVFADPITITWLLVIVFVAYNFWPIVFWLLEKAASSEPISIKLEKEKKEDEKEEKKEEPQEEAQED